MNLSHIRSYLNEKERTPQVDSSEYEVWLEFTDVLEFLMRSSMGQVPVYISTKGYSIFLYSIFVPKQKLVGDYIDDIFQWNLSVSSGWGYGYWYNPNTKQPEKGIYSPISGTATTALEDEEPVFFLRSLYHDGDSYLEINQRFAHILEVHKNDQRKAYCKVNDTGELVDVVTYDQENGKLCTVDRNALDFYLFLTGTVLVRVFNIQRLDKSSFSAWRDEKEAILLTDKSNEIYARRTINSSNTAGFLRGFQIIRNNKSDSEMIINLEGKASEKEYTPFIAIDWKHETVHECSCDPEKLGNYFVKSDFPYETSPAFFKPEVIAKYKQNTDKYQIEDGNITCRGAWSLRYDTNNEGQIQAYLIDLSHLPSSEQLYWKSFNEAPKAGIAEHVFKRDFEASWDLPHDPLVGLKQLLRRFPCVTYGDEDYAIWQLSDQAQLSRLTYVMTDSVKEWKDQILELAQVLGDGLRKEEIRKIAQYLGCDDSQLGSIKLLKKCLEAKNIDAETIQTIFQPLQTLWALRSKISAHPGGSVPNEDLKLHYRKLVAVCEQAMKALAALIREKYLDILVNL